MNSKDSHSLYYEIFAKTDNSINKYMEVKRMNRQNQNNRLEKKLETIKVRDLKKRIDENLQLSYDRGIDNVKINTYFNKNNASLYKNLISEEFKDYFHIQKDFSFKKGILYLKISSNYSASSYVK